MAEKFRYFDECSSCIMSGVTLLGWLIEIPHKRFLYVLLDATYSSTSPGR